MEELLWQSNDKLEARVTERTEELAESHKRLRALGEELTATEQRERHRLAMDLHDDLAQLLSLTRIKLSLAKQQTMQAPLAKIITEVEEVTDKALHADLDVTAQSTRFIRVRPADGSAMAVRANAAARSIRLGTGKDGDSDDDTRGASVVAVSIDP